MKFLNERHYDSPSSSKPFISVRPSPVYAWTHIGAIFTIEHNGKQLIQPVWYAHATLLALLQNNFHSVLDLGSNEGLVSHIFKFLDKDVIALEPCTPFTSLPEITIYPPDIERDYLDVKFSKKFDAIWCSHVLEHVRNPGQFLEKIFDDLHDDGFLALTVPFHDLGGDIFSIAIGHHNHYNTALLIYQLVCAGFDCREISVAVFNNQIGLILKKKPNNLPKVSAALTQGAGWMGAAKNLADFFPFPINSDHGRYDKGLINWAYPV